MFLTANKLLVSPLEFRRIYATVLTGFGDYTVDPRGDVGSWVRMATLRAITSISQVIFRHRSRLEPFDDYIPPNLWHKAIGKMLKQGVERLDSVRVIAGGQLMHLLWDPDVRKHASGTWAIPGLEKLELAFPLLVFTKHMVCHRTDFHTSVTSPFLGVSANGCSLESRLC
jgi:hypothetical protein